MWRKTISIEKLMSTSWIIIWSLPIRGKHPLLNKRKEELNLINFINISYYYLGEYQLYYNRIADRWDQNIHPHIHYTVYLYISVCIYIVLTLSCKTLLNPNPMNCNRTLNSLPDWLHSTRSNRFYNWCILHRSHSFYSYIVQMRCDTRHRCWWYLLVIKVIKIIKNNKY